MTTKTTVRRDDKTHLYFDASGQPLAGVTEMFKSLGFIDTTYYTDKGRDRGSNVHLACQYFDEGDLDESSLPEDVKGRMAAYKKFRQDTGFTPIGIEEVVSSDVLRTAGTLDRTGIFAGSAVEALLDIKGGAPDYWHPYQTAGYSMMKWHTEYDLHPRFALYLRDNGTYRLEPHKDPRDFDVFRSISFVYHAKRGK